MASPVWMPILTRIGGDRSAKDRSISRWIACAQATARRALEKASIDPSPWVSTTVPPWAVVTLLDHRIVPADDLDPGVVAESGEHDGRVDDVREDDRDRAVDSERSGQVRLGALERPFELVERDRQRPSESLLVRPRERPVDVDHLPLAVLEVEDVRRAGLERPALPVDRLLDPRPADCPLFPGMDLSRRDREGPGLLHLLSPDRPRLFAPPELGRVRPDHQRADMVRQPREIRVGVACRDRHRPPLDDAADLI